MDSLYNYIILSSRYINYPFNWKWNEKLYCDKVNNISLNCIKMCGFKLWNVFTEHSKELSKFYLLQFFYFFLAFDILSVLRGHSVFPSSPQRPMTSDFEGFLYKILSIILFSYRNSWERASIFPWVLNKGTTGTIFITSLVWRGPWLGIEPGTSRTRCQYSTTRLSVLIAIV